MKKNIFFLTLLCLAITLCACGSDGKSEQEIAATSQTGGKTTSLTKSKPKNTGKTITTTKKTTGNGTSRRKYEF